MESKVKEVRPICTGRNGVSHPPRTMNHHNKMMVGQKRRQQWICPKCGRTKLGGLVVE